VEDEHQLEYFAQFIDAFFLFFEEMAAERDSIPLLEAVRSLALLCASKCLSALCSGVARVRWTGQTVLAV
jgi:hypothetical protein